jgi:hypothetical protein
MNQDKASIIPLSSIQLPLMEFIKEGILVISEQLSPIYMNSKGREIYQKIINEEQSDLPHVLKEIAYYLRKHPEPSQSIIRKEYSLPNHSIIRIRATPISEPVDSNISSRNYEKPWIIFCLEDYDSRLEEDLNIQQEKYGLTQRETEVLQLLLHSNTYKDIALKLYIEINTVRFHVKNIYMKKRKFDN